MAIPQRKAKQVEPRLYSPKQAKNFLEDYSRMVEDHLAGDDQSKEKTVVFLKKLINLLYNDCFDNVNLPSTFFAYFTALQFVHVDPSLLDAFLGHHTLEKLLQFLKDNLRFSLDANLGSHRLEIGDGVLRGENLDLLKSTFCRMFLCRSKEWPKRGVGSYEANRLISVIKPYEQLLEAKQQGSLARSYHESGSIEGSEKLSKIIEVYEQLKSKVLDREKEAECDMNIAEDVNFRCWLDEISRGIRSYRECLLKCQMVYHFESLQQYAEMVFFYLGKASLLRRKPQEIPIYQYQDMMAVNEPKGTMIRSWQPELIFDEGGLQRIKNVSRDVPDPNFPANEQEKPHTNKEWKAKSEQGSSAMTPNFKKINSDPQKVSKKYSYGNASVGKNSRGFQNLFESQVSNEHKELKLFLRSKTCKEILLPTNSENLKSSTQPRLSDLRLPSENNIGTSVPHSELRGTRKMERQKSNVMLNSKLIKEIHNESLPRQFNFEITKFDDEEKKFGEFVSSRLSNQSLRKSNNTTNESPLSTKKRPSLSKFSPSPSKAQIEQFVSDSDYFSNYVSPDKLSFGEAMPIDQSPNNPKPVPKGLPEILETLNDYDDDSDNYFKEMSDKEFSKFKLSFKRAEDQSGKESRQLAKGEQPELHNRAMVFNFKKTKKLPEEQFASSPAQLSTLKLDQNQGQAAQTSDAFQKYVNSLKDLVQTTPKSLQAECESLNKFYSIVESPTMLPRDSRLSLELRVDDVKPHQIAVKPVSYGPISDPHVDNALSICSQSFDDFSKEESPQEPDISFRTALPLLDVSADNFQTEASQFGQKGLIARKHEKLIKTGWSLQRVGNVVEYEGEKPRGFNPNFPNGRVLFTDSCLQLKIEHATLSSFGNAFLSECSERKDATIIFDLMLTNIGSLPVEVAKLIAEEGKDIRLELEENPLVIKGLKPGETFLIRKVSTHVRVVPYRMPAFKLEYFTLEKSGPKQAKLQIVFPIFYQCFFSFVRLRSGDAFRYDWDCLQLYCYYKLVTPIFIGKFDFVKDELHLKAIFPGAILLDRFEEKVSNKVIGNHLEQPTTFCQYGMALRSQAEENFLIRLNLDLTNAVYIECLVENPSLSAKADFLLQHIQFVISE